MLVALTSFQPTVDSVLHPYAMGVPISSSHIFYDYCSCPMCEPSSSSPLNPFAARFTPSLKRTAEEFVPAMKVTSKKQCLRATAAPFVTRTGPRLRSTAKEFVPTCKATSKKQSLSATAPPFVTRTRPKELDQRAEIPLTRFEAALDALPPYGQRDIGKWVQGLPANPDDYVEMGDHMAHWLHYDLDIYVVKVLGDF